VALIVIRASADTDAASTYTERYVTKDIQSSGALAHVMLSAFPGALYLLLRRRFVAFGLDRQIVLIGSLVSLATLPLVAVSSTGADRFGLYFSYVQLWVYPSIVSMYGRKSHGALVSLTTLLSIAIFVTYFTYGVTVCKFVPYENVLFPL
jgi:hypothetical protein